MRTTTLNTVRSWGTSRRTDAQWSLLQVAFTWQFVGVTMRLSENNTWTDATCFPLRCGSQCRTLFQHALCNQSSHAPLLHRRFTVFAFFVLRGFVSGCRWNPALKSLGLIDVDGFYSAPSSAMLHLTHQPMAVVEALGFSWTSRNRIRVTRIAHVHIEGSHCCGYQVCGSLHWNQLWQDKIVNHTPRLPHDFFTAHADTKNTPLAPLALVRPNSCVDLRCKS